MSPLCASVHEGKRSRSKGTHARKDGNDNYYAARWEIWDAAGEKLLLAGDSAGKTVTPEGGDGIWDGHGVVTEARRGFRELKGRHIYETGPVFFSEFPYSGTGLFVIY